MTQESTEAGTGAAAWRKDDSLNPSFQWPTGLVSAQLAAGNAKISAPSKSDRSHLSQQGGIAFVMKVSPLLLTVDYRAFYIGWVDWQKLFLSSQLPDLGHHDNIQKSWAPAAGTSGINELWGTGQSLGAVSALGNETRQRKRLGEG